MMRPGHWLGLVLHVPYSVLTMMVGWQEGHTAHKNSRCTNLQMFSSRTGGGGLEGELAAAGSPGKTAIKWN